MRAFMCVLNHVRRLFEPLKSLSPSIFFFLCDTKKFIKGAYDLYKNLDPTTLIKGAMKACKKNFFGFACDI